MSTHGLGPVEGWTADDYIVDFWEQSQAWAVQQYAAEVRGSNVTVDDVRGHAAEVLIVFARDEFDGVVRRMRAVPRDRRLFWVLFKRYAAWRFTDYLKAYRRYDSSVQELEEVPTRAWSRVRLARALDDAGLHRQLVEHIGTLQPVDQFTLATCFYEQMSRARMQPLLDLSPNTVNARVRTAAANVRHEALRLTSQADETPVLERALWSGERAAAWVQGTYGCTVDAYLRFVLVTYRADVAPLLDMLTVGSGGIVKNEMPDGRRVAHRTFLVDEQVVEIRARLTLGQSYATIAAAVGIDEQAVGRIKRGESYTYVLSPEGAAA